MKFQNEEAEDAGGVRKEFFMLLLKEILDPKYGMFTHYEETRAIWFSEIPLEDEGMYFLIGKFAFDFLQIALSSVFYSCFQDYCVDWPSTTSQSSTCHFR